MTRAVEQGVRPVALLMNDTRPVSVVVEPRRARLAGEALDAAERCVLSYNQCQLDIGSSTRLYLDRDFGTEVGRDAIVVADIGNDVHAVLSRIGRKLGEELHWPATCM